MTANPHLLVPPREEEEVYPFRRVWRSVVLEGGIMLVTAVGCYFLVSVLGLQIPKSFYRPVGFILAVMPACLWAAFSLWPERTVPQPRERLLVVAVISALVANAVGIPLINEFLQVERWLPLSSAITRIAGFTCTVGVVQEMLKYLVVRYTVWPNGFRVRLDGAAYGSASAVGYLTVLNLHFAFTGFPPPDAVAIEVFTNLSIHLAASILVGYGLGQVCLGRPSPFLLPTTVFFASLITGVAIPVRAGLVNAGLGLSASLAKPMMGLAFSAVLLFGMLLVLIFLFGSAERQAREAMVEEI